MKFKNKLIVMLMSSVNKRLLKELQTLVIQQNSKNLLENDYLISFDDSDIKKVHAIIKCPYDSVYRHKFIRLDFDIPDNYPHSPPKVNFINYDSVRIHPNMYEDGKCCSTILNTWPSDNEKWTSSMGIETILLTFHSFLDYNPYTYEHGGHDNDSYTEYVTYQSWYTCLIRYLENRNKQPELFTTFISNYLLQNIGQIIDDIRDLHEEFPPDAYSTDCFYIGYYTINYIQVINKLGEWYNFLNYKENIETDEIDISFNDFSNIDYSCNICFDTSGYNKQIKLLCNHDFHIECIKLHINNNGNICSLCRTDINTEDLKKINESNCSENTKIIWIINPETKRKVKIGSRTYKRLKTENII